MIPQRYLWIIRIATLFSFLILGYVVMWLDPESGYGAKLFFYGAFFLGVALFLNLILLRLRKGLMHGEMIYENIILSLRQGILLALILTILLWLQGMRVLLWWNGLLVVAGVFLVELYFLFRDNDS